MKRSSAAGCYWIWVEFQAKALTLTRGVDSQTAKLVKENLLNIKSFTIHYSARNCGGDLSIEETLNLVILTLKYKLQ